jgi:hypothetical protein
MNSLIGKAVSFDGRHLHVELSDGRIISTPMAWYPELQHATVEQINHYTFICAGTGVEWPDMDYHLSIESMMLGQAKENAA